MIGDYCWDGRTKLMCLSLTRTRRGYSDDRTPYPPIQAADGHNLGHGRSRSPLAESHHGHLSLAGLILLDEQIMASTHERQSAEMEILMCPIELHQPLAGTGFTTNNSFIFANINDHSLRHYEEV